jgi:hypothetical protein
MIRKARDGLQRKASKPPRKSMRATTGKVSTTNTASCDVTDGRRVNKAVWEVYAELYPGSGPAITVVRYTLDAM